MTTIVMNTLNGAVTEYDWTFQSITPAYAGDAVALYTLGGDKDGLANIVSEATTGNTQWGDAHKKFVEMIYFAVRGDGSGECIVGTRNDEYRYGFLVQESGESRVKPGRGIRENYLSFGFSNPDGSAFTLDRIEVAIVPSATRRI